MKNILLLFLFSVSCSLFAAVNIEHKATQKKQRIYNSYRVLNSSPVKYTIDYVVTTIKGVKYVGDRSSKSTGIGLNNGWYSSGSIRIFVDNKSLTTPSKITCKDDTIFFIWDEATLKMTFPEGSDKIYCQVTAKNANKLKLGFLAMPGFLPKRKVEMQSYVSTNKINHFLNDGKYKSNGEFWYMFYDVVSNKRGIPVVILDPNEVKRSEVDGGAKKLLITSKFEMKTTSCRFILMGIPNNHMDAETLYEDLKENGNKYLQDLKAFKFK